MHKRLFNTRSLAQFLVKSSITRKFYATALQNTPKTRKIILFAASGASVLGLGLYINYLEDPRNEKKNQEFCLRLRACTDKEAMEKLERYGACVLTHRQIPKETVEKWYNITKEKFDLHLSNPDPIWGDLQFRPVFTRRFHMNLLVHKDLKKEFETSAEDALLEFVVSFFSQFKDKPNIFLSEMQMLVSQPNSVNQFWHRDNSKLGISFTIPLHDTTLELGPTQIMTNSHKKSSDTPHVITCELKAGEVLAYDARLLHRGTGNHSIDQTRMAIAIRYDFQKTPPPGTNIIGTTLTRARGRIQHMWIHLRDSIFG
jgi:hypothetical protein